MARPIAEKHRRRMDRVIPVSQALVQEARRDYEAGLREATIEQKYNRTPLPVTHKMLNSIGSRVIPDGIEVGYNLGSGQVNAPYVDIVLNMKGRSKRGGHDLSMNPNQYLRNRVDGKVRRRNDRAIKEINGD